MLPYHHFLANKNFTEKLTNHAINSLEKSIEIALREKSEKTENIHLLRAIYHEKGSAGAIILQDFGLKAKHFPSLIRKFTKKETRRILPYGQFASEELKKVLLKAFSLAKELGYPYVGTEHLVYALLVSSDKKIKKIFSQLPKTENDNSPKNNELPLELNLPLKNQKRVGPGDLFNFPLPANIFDNFLNPKDSSANSSTPFLDKFCTNLNTKKEIKEETIIGRESETGRIISILGRKTKNNPLLVGSPGVGKTALVYKLAQLINSHSVPDFLLDKKILSLDIAALIAGTGFRGEFEQRLKEIIKETISHKNIILFIDELHNIIGAGNISGSLDLANILKPALSRGEIQIIGATTQREYKKHIEKDAALERRFQPVPVKEPSVEETKKILLGIRNDYEEFHNISIESTALELSVELSHRYIKDRFLPDKAIDVLDETAAILRSRNLVSELSKKIKLLEQKKEVLRQEKEKIIQAEDYEKAIYLRSQEKELSDKIKILKSQQKETEKIQPLILSMDDIVQTVAKMSGIPQEKLARTKTQKLKNVSSILSSHIIGQNEAIEKISSVVLRSQFGLSNPDRPLGSFLFLGPSGVGKSLTAKVLAREFFGDNRSIIKFDMSEFMERHSISALIGSPAGYVGYGEGGRLTEKVRQNPYSVILFDEIEKAHSDVFNILLQILEDGTLTDAEGTEVSFKNTIIILTTNIGTEEFNALPVSRLGFQLEKKNKELDKLKTIKVNTLEELEDRVRPEILNRLDHIILFNPLSSADIEKICQLEMSLLKERLECQQLVLSFSKEVLKFLAKKSLAPTQGARLIRKNIQEMIEDKIARMIMEEKIKHNRVKIDIKKNQLQLK